MTVPLFAPLFAPEVLDYMRLVHESNMTTDVTIARASIVRDDSGTKSEAWSAVWSGKMRVESPIDAQSLARESEGSAITLAGALPAMTDVRVRDVLIISGSTLNLAWLITVQVLEVDGPLTNEVVRRVRGVTLPFDVSLVTPSLVATPDTATALINDWMPSDAGSGHARFADSASALNAEPVATFEPTLLVDSGGTWARYTGTQRATTASTPFLQYESVMCVLRTNAAYMLTALNARVYEHLDTNDGGRGRALTLDLGQGGDVAYVSGGFARPIRAAAEAQWEGGETHTLGYVDDGTRLWMYVDGIARSYYQHNGSLWTGVQTSYESPFNKAGMQAGGAGVPINFGWFGYVASLNAARFDIGRTRRWSRALSALDMAQAHTELRAVYPGLS